MRFVNEVSVVRSCPVLHEAKEPTPVAVGDVKYAFWVSLSL
jgi:hypothetical protein